MICPYCKETIIDGALICRFCGKDQPADGVPILANSTSAQPQPPNGSSPVPPALSQTDKVRKNAGIGCLIIIGIIALLGIATVNNTLDENPTSEQSVAAPIDDKSTPIVPALEIPTHHWSYKEGGEYGYSGALSDDDRKAGLVSENIIMYRFLGEKDGVYSVAINSDGVLLVASCTNPCEVAKIAVGGRVVNRFAFNPDSIVGNVLSDAFAGELEVYHSPK